MTKHLTFDFAEKVHLPRLQNQPGQIYYTTGLKVDLFGVYVANIDKQITYTLIEGHWSMAKNANLVCSMIHNVLKDPRVACLPHARNLVLHADNCAGQNKNKYVMSYLAWRVMVGLNDSIKLHFMVSGHTKNICDAYFGLFKRKVKRRDVWTPRDMMTVVNACTESSICKPGSDVQWTNWKDLTAQYLGKSIQNISGVGHFEFSTEHPGTVRLRLMKDSSAVEVDLRQSVSISPSVAIDIDMARFPLTTVPLCEVKSAAYKTREGYLKTKIAEKYRCMEPGFIHESTT